MSEARCGPPPACSAWPWAWPAPRLVRTRRHKLIVWKDPTRGNEIYDLARDPREEENLSGRPGMETLEADLLRRLRVWLERTDDPARRWPKLAEPPRERPEPEGASPSSGGLAAAGGRGLTALR